LRGYFNLKYPPQPLEITPGEAITPTGTLPGIEALITHTMPFSDTTDLNGGDD
jgi:hypothetical protein